MFNDKNIARLLDVANAACHGGNIVDARSLYEAVLTLKPDFVPAKIGFAYSHLVIDEFEEAALILHSILDDNPNDEDALSMLGFILYLVGDMAEMQGIMSALSGSNAAHVQQFSKLMLSAPAR